MSCHVHSLLSIGIDGTSLGLYWMLAVLMGQSEAVGREASSDYATSAVVTFRTWLQSANIRLFAILLQGAMMDHTINFNDVQNEIASMLVMMMAWRATYVAAMKMIDD